MGHRPTCLLPILAMVAVLASGPSDSRRPSDDKELKGWLENMVWYHRYTPEEIRAATGLKPAEIDAALKRHAGLLGDPLQVAAALGGRELAAILGATLAARQRRVRREGRDGRSSSRRATGSRSAAGSAN